MASRAARKGVRSGATEGAKERARVRAKGDALAHVFCVKVLLSPVIVLHGMVAKAGVCPVNVFLTPLNSHST